jgi:tetratricopeptide (TPR) repeat protein
MAVLALAAIARLIYATHGVVAPWKYLLAQGPAPWRYLRLIVLPFGFTVDPDIRAPAVWLSVLCWAAFLAGAVKLWQSRRSEWAVWMLAGLLLLLPNCLLPSTEFYADQRMYLAMFGFAAAAGLLLTRVRSQALATSVAVALTLLSVVRTTVWMSDRSLWQEAVARAPQKVRPKVQLSRSLPAADALELLANARNLDLHDPSVPAEMGKILLQEHQVDGALIELGHAITLDPRNAECYNNRGVAFSLSGLTEAARSDFQSALDIDPNLSEARENLAKLPPPQ